MRLFTIISQDCFVFVFVVVVVVVVVVVIVVVVVVRSNCGHGFWVHDWLSNRSLSCYNLKEHCWTVDRTHHWNLITGTADSPNLSKWKSSPMNTSTTVVWYSHQCVDSLSLW